MTITISAADIEAAFAKIMSEPPPVTFVFDTLTESIGEVIEDLGLAPDEHGALSHRFFVEVLEPQAHHKKLDRVIWRDPEPV